jgi:hypothetical protein
VHSLALNLANIKRRRGAEERGRGQAGRLPRLEDGEAGAVPLAAALGGGSWPQMLPLWVGSSGGEASKMMGRDSASSGGAPLRRPPLQRGGARVGRGGAR